MNKTCRLSCIAQQLFKEEYVVFPIYYWKSSTCATFPASNAVKRWNPSKKCSFPHKCISCSCFGLVLPLKVEICFEKDTSSLRYALYFKYGIPFSLFHDENMSSNRCIFLCRKILHLKLQQPVWTTEAILLQNIENMMCILLQNMKCLY